MKTEIKYGLIFGSIVALMLFIFDIRNYVFSPPAGLNFGEPIDFILMSPTYPVWKILDVLPKYPAWLDIGLTFIITVAIWLIIGYVVGLIKSRIVATKTK